MLNTAGQLRTVDQSTPVKQASAAHSPYLQAEQALGRVMEQYGLGSPRMQEEDLAQKQAAYQLSQDPTLYNSILALKLDEAAQLQQHLAQSA